MKHIVVSLGLIFSGLIFCFSVALTQEGKGKDDKAPDGKKIFVENKCSSCHSIESVGIKKKTKDNESTELKPPDLSSVGSERKADWITKYLQKKLDGEKHPKKFKGSDEELTTLAKWLETLEADTTKKGKK